MAEQGNARRDSGEGSVYKRADGRWVAQVEAGRHENGRRRYARAVRATQKEALKALTELHRQADAGLNVDKTRTVAAYLDWWCDNVLRGSVKVSTEDDYRGVIKRWIVPHIGNVRLGKLTPAHVQTMLRNLEDSGRGPRSRQYARAILVSALRWANQTGIIERNPAQLVDGPKLGRAANLADALTADQARTLIDHAKDDRLLALVILVLRLGLRRGEALGLRWDLVDLETGGLTIAGTLKERRGELYLDTPKTASSHRSLPLPADVLAALRDHKRRQAAERLAAGPEWDDSGFVFTTETGSPIKPQVVTRWWPQLCIDAGIGRHRFHASRHTAATLMLDDGTPLEIVSAVLGHASLSITADVYAKVTKDAMRRALSLGDLGTAPPPSTPQRSGG